MKCKNNKNDNIKKNKKILFNVIENDNNNILLNDDDIQIYLLISYCIQSS